MKKNHIFFAMKICIMLTFIIIWNLITKNDEIPQNNYDDISSDISFSSDPIYSFLEFIKSDSVLKDNFNLNHPSIIDINKYFDNFGNIIYLVNVTPKFMWGTQLYMIFVDDDKITKIVGTPFFGSKAHFSYDVVNISQGSYIAVYSSTHMGNGYLEFASTSSPDTIKYAIPFVVDYDYEDNRLIAIEHGLSSENDDDLTASAVYLGSKLHATYDDVDEDGSTDIILTGIQQIYETDKNDEQILRKEYYIKSVYLYNSIKDDFFFNEGLSKKIPIEIIE